MFRGGESGLGAGRPEQRRGAGARRQARVEALRERAARYEWVRMTVYNAMDF